MGQVVTCDGVGHRSFVLLGIPLVNQVDGFNASAKDGGKKPGNRIARKGF